MSEGARPLVSVIVPTWNGADDTIRCLRALERNTAARLHLVWIDNGSDRAQHAAVREAVAAFDHDLEDHPEPLGFAGAVNRGLPYVRGEYTALLNNDAEVSPGWDVDLRRAVDAAPGAAGPLLLDARIGWQSTRRHRWLDLPRERLDAEGLAGFLRSRWGGWAVDLPLRPGCPVGGFRRVLAFFCVLFPTAVVRALGPLDEGFGAAYFEDDDYCMRLRREGGRLSLCPGSSVRHEGGRTTRHLRDPGLLARNAARFEEKWGEASDLQGSAQPGDSPRLWALPEGGEAPDAPPVPLALWTPPPPAPVAAPSVAVSLYLPEPSDGLEEQLANLARFLGDPLVVLQLGKGVVARELLERWPRLRVDPARSGHPVPAHVHGFRRLRDEAAFDVLVLGSGRERYFAPGASHRLARFPAGLELRPLAHADGPTRRALAGDAGLSALCRHLGGVRAHVSPLGGAFFRADLFDELASLVERFFRSGPGEAAPALDAYLPTAAAALTGSVGAPLVHWVPERRTAAYDDLEAAAAQRFDVPAAFLDDAPFGIAPVGVAPDDPVRCVVEALCALRAHGDRRDRRPR